MKIKELTKEQQDLLPIYRERWSKIGLSTEPLNFEKAKLAVCQAYESAGLQKPINFYKTKSPVDAIRLIKKLFPEYKRDEILSGMLFGNHDANWLSFYEYFRDVCKIKICHKLDGLIDLAQHCGWLNVYKDTVVFQDRPEIIKIDEQNRLHNEIGPAIKYRDGFSIYSWHGISIPKEWIENKADLSPKMALTWKNIEQRRAACEIVGWSKILNDLDAHIIDKDEDPMIGVLIEVFLPGVGKEKFLKVLCGTGREFAIPVPPNMKTALEANAWTYGLDKDIIRQLEVRT